MSIQRLTAAHKLGHFSMHHLPSLDDETILRPMSPTGQPTADFQEVEADAFAIEFMMPRWIIHWHAARQSWTTEALRKPDRVYQLALRIGASYEATCWTLVRHRLTGPEEERHHGAFTPSNAIKYLGSNLGVATP